MRRRSAPALLLVALIAVGATPLRAQVADPTTLPPQPGTPASPCQPKLGETNTWDVLSDHVLVNTTSSFDPDQWPELLRSSVDPEVPCLMYRTVNDPRSLERSTDGGRTFQRVFHDGRTAGNGTPARITGVYTPARGVVYLSEAGNGTAVVKSEDSGATWRVANTGIAGRAIGRMAVAPSNPDVAYAVAETGAGNDAAGTLIDIFVTRDGGDSWSRLLDSQLAHPRPRRQSYSLAVDPADPGHLMIAIQGVAAAVAGTPEPGSVLLESEDYGATVTPVRAGFDAAEVVFARRGDNALRLYALANGANGTTNGVQYSDDAAGHWGMSTWTRVEIGVEGVWFGGLVDPVASDKMLYFGKPKYQRSSMLLALYTRNGFVDQEIGEQPAINQSSYYVSQYRTDRFGQFYIDVGMDCRFFKCPEGAKTGNFGFSMAWTTIRFRPPDPGQAYKLRTEKQPDPVRGGTFASVSSAQCTVEPQPPLYGGDPNDDAGSLAFDGTRMYYTRRAERGPDPWSAVIRVADPSTCTGGRMKETGRLVVHFDPAVYQEARRRAVSDVDGSPLLPERPSIDSLGYDSLHDELWFSVTRSASFVDPYNGDPDGSPIPLWAVRRGGEGVDRAAELRFWDNPCGIGAIGLLSHDRVRDTLWTCDRKVPGERTRAGRSLVTCLHPIFQGYASGGADVWNIRAWGVSTPGTLVAVKDASDAFPPRKVAQYDARTCTLTDEWRLPPTDNVPEPDQGRGGVYVSSQLVCDPLTFRDRLDNATAPAAVAWLREGRTFTPYKVTPLDGPGLVCPWPTVLSYTGAVQVDPGQRLDACVTVSVPGSGGGIPAVPVRISVAGAPAVNTVSNGQGRACVPYSVPADALAGSRVSVKGWVLEDAHMLASAIEGSVAVGNIPVPPPAVVILPPPPAPPPPPVPLLPAPAPAPAPQPGVQPAVTPPGQAVAQQGFAGEKEREVQLAHAQQEETGHDFASAPASTEAPTDDYAFTLAVAAALVLGSIALGRALGRSSAPSVSAVYAFEADAAGRRRRRRLR